ncbi:diguanylate cyclase [Oceanospirillum sp.]|uniref:GGDEF domain-containing protein n=1 Tax=Oceanospirillum sp. TaxID=2021254 RepID=UPI003A8D83A3
MHQSGKRLRRRLAAIFALLLLVCALAITYYLKEARRHVGADYTSMVTDVIRAQTSISELHQILESLLKEREKHHLEQLNIALMRIDRRVKTVRHSLNQSDLPDTDYTPQFEEIKRAEDQLSELLQLLNNAEENNADTLDIPHIHRLGMALEQNLAWAYSELNERLHLASATQRQLMQWLSIAVIGLLLLVVLIIASLMLALMRIHQQNSALLHQSQTDTLTGLYNRRRMYRIAEQELARIQRNGGSMGLILIDLDHFKQINDTYGHPTGDAVLKAFSAMLIREIREIDIAVRMGGEEFAIIMPGCDKSSAHALAERIRKAAIALKLPNSLRLTASFGASATQGLGDTFEQLFSRTDKLLYKAKIQGRNSTQVG